MTNNEPTDDRDPTLLHLIQELNRDVHGPDYQAKKAKYLEEILEADRQAHAGRPGHSGTDRSELGTGDVIPAPVFDLSASNSVWEFELENSVNSGEAERPRRGMKVSRGKLVLFGIVAIAVCVLIGIGLVLAPWRNRSLPTNGRVPGPEVSLDNTQRPKSGDGHINGVYTDRGLQEGPNAMGGPTKLIYSHDKYKPSTTVEAKMKRNFGAVFLITSKKAEFCYPLIKQPDGGLIGKASKIIEFDEAEEFVYLIVVLYEIDRPELHREGRVTWLSNLELNELQAQGAKDASVGAAQGLLFAALTKRDGKTGNAEIDVTRYKHVTAARPD